MVDIYKVLHPRSFFLRNSRTWVHEEIQIPEMEMDGLKLHLQSTALEWMTAEAEADGGKERSVDEGLKLHIFRHKYVLRGIRPEELAEAQAAAESEDFDALDSLVVFGIEAIFEAAYFTQENLSPDDLAEFGVRNVPFNLHPFWREYVQATSMRMGFERPIPVGLKAPLVPS